MHWNKAVGKREKSQGVLVCSTNFLFYHDALGHPNPEPVYEY